MDSDQGNADFMAWALVVAAIIMILVIVILTNVYKYENKWISDLSILFFTIFVSWQVTKYYSQQMAREDLKELGEAAGQRIFLLSSQILELADDIDSYESPDEKTDTYLTSLASQMDKLAKQAELSFEDIQRLAQLDISIPELKDEAQTRVKERYKNEDVKCPSCNEVNSFSLTTSPGSTKHVTCESCDERFMVHRLKDMSIKISFDETISMRCPECSNNITINRDKWQYGQVVRNCYECYARIKYDLDEGEVVGHEVESPISVNDDYIFDGEVECPYCGKISTDYGIVNDDGDHLQTCTNCTRLLRIVDE